MLKKIKSLAFMKNYAESKGGSIDDDGAYLISGGYVVSDMFKFMGRRYEMSHDAGRIWPYRIEGARNYDWPEWMVEDVD